MGRVFALLLVVTQVGVPPATLPAAAAASLRASLADAAQHRQHLWRDTAPLNDDASVNAYIEIPRGERRKYEFSIALHERVVDRVMSKDIGGYPVNYGFVPQTISYDGDPFDVLVLGAALRGGAVVRGMIVGIMHMEDEKGLDSKVVLSPIDRYGRATQPIRASDQRRMTEFFNRYKRGEPGKFARVLGWGSLDEARAFLNQTSAFFRYCAQQSHGDCTAPRAPHEAVPDGGEHSTGGAPGTSRQTLQLRFVANEWATPMAMCASLKGPITTRRVSASTT